MKDFSCAEAILWFFLAIGLTSIIGVFLFLLGSSILGIIEGHFLSTIFGLITSAILFFCLKPFFSLAKKTTMSDSFYNKNEKDKHDIYFKEKSKYDPKAYVEIMLYLMCDIVIADKNKLVCELDVIKDFIRRNHPSKYDEHVKTVKKILSLRTIPFDKKVKYCQILNDEYSLKEREIFLDYLFSVAYVDGDCVLSEKVSLTTIIGRMFSEYTKKEREKLYDKYRVKYEKKQNKYRGNHGSFNGSNSSQNSSHFNSNNSSDTNSGNHKSVLSPELQKAYAALGIREDATESELRARWRNLMRVNHPDTVAVKGADAVQSATMKCQEINKAFEKIKVSRGMK